MGERDKRPRCSRSCNRQRLGGDQALTLARITVTVVDIIIRLFW